jgi:23S rRNA-/tRNA-specific pseudouridylate synthase
MIDPVFEDDFILALNKPSGLPSQNQEDPDQDTAERRVKMRSPDLPPHLLHRLDTGTSGVLLFAKTEAVFQEMREKFRNRSIAKSYLAWSPTGLPARELNLPLRIDLPLAHHPQNKKRMIVLPEGKFRRYRGKPLPAITWIDSIRECEISGIPLLKFAIRIETGVMHQIRVHLAHSGFPLLGDPLYGNRADPSSGFRLGLHARCVEFDLYGARYRIHAPEPETLQQIP